MIDLSGHLAAHLRDNVGLMAEVDNAVYADVMPKDVTYPAVLIRTLEATPVVAGVPGWHDYSMQLDVYGAEEDFAGTVAIVDDVADLVRATPSDGSIVIATSDVTGLRSAPDDSISPAHPRWVLSVSMTARSTPQGIGGLS
jgi:hypothetical protein